MQEGAPPQGAWAICRTVGTGQVDASNWGKKGARGPGPQTLSSMDMSLQTVP